MRKLILLIAVVLFYVACKQNVPKGVIEKSEMMNVLLDMQVTDAALNQVYNNDTMKMQAHSRYNYIFKKYKIDSATFTNSLKYYSRNAKELDSMYTQISDSLVRLQESLKPKPVINYAKMQADSVYNFLFPKFTKDSAKFTNKNYYNLDVKGLYGRYTQILDSLKHLQDSIKKKQVKNDLSTK
jgi:hypothetical protein